MLRLISVVGLELTHDLEFWYIVLLFNSMLLWNGDTAMLKGSCNNNILCSCNVTVLLLYYPDTLILCSYVIACLLWHCVTALSMRMWYFYYVILYAYVTTMLLCFYCVIVIPFYWSVTVIHCLCNITGLQCYCVTDVVLCDCCVPVLPC